MSIARLAGLGDDTYYRFDSLDDELSLARTEVYGSIEQCRLDLQSELESYPSIDVLTCSD